MKIRRIRWRDSRLMILQDTQDSPEYTVAIIESVGFVIQEDKDKIVLAGDIVEEDARRVIVIPKENIIKNSSR